eukprot:201107-Prymnesium_polylepis.1
MASSATRRSARCLSVRRRRRMRLAGQPTCFGPSRAGARRRSRSSTSSAHASMGSTRAHRR